MSSASNICVLHFEIPDKILNKKQFLQFPIILVFDKFLKWNLTIDSWTIQSYLYLCIDLNVVTKLMVYLFESRICVIGFLHYYILFFQDACPMSIQPAILRNKNKIDFRGIPLYLCIKLVSSKHQPPSQNSKFRDPPSNKWNTIK